MQTPINAALAAGTRGQPEPTVGMGATILLWSDRHAATIIEIQRKRGAIQVTVQEDLAKVVRGSAHDGSAEYEYQRNPAGRIRHFKADGPDSAWHEVRWNDDTRRWNRTKTGVRLRIGTRDEYRDPSF